jgi:hypothetical protein
MPRDYKRVLAAMEQARESGADVDAAVMAAAAAPAPAAPPARPATVDLDAPEGGPFPPGVLQQAPSTVGTKH